MHCFVYPNEPIDPGGFDNCDGRLIVYLNQVINDSYIVKDILGSGAYSDVYRVEKNTHFYALKISKACVGHKELATKEASILKLINNYYDEDDRPNIGQMFDWFEYHGHIVIVLELYKFSLFTLLRQRDSQGLPFRVVQKIARDISQALEILNNINVIHCDIKSDNLVIDMKENIRLIDFGGCINSGDISFTYIQTRHYRAPEVFLEMDTSPKIDIWSFGCVLAECFIGIPIFCGKDSAETLKSIEKRIGHFPSTMTSALNGIPAEYFDAEGNVICERFVDQFAMTSLSDIIMNGFTFLSEDATPKEVAKENEAKTLFKNLLLGMLQIDPHDRYDLATVRLHPFLNMDL